MLERILNPKNRVNLIVIGSSIFILALLIIIIIWSIVRSPVRQSEVIFRDEYNIEILLRDTNAFGELDFIIPGWQNIHINQDAPQEMRLALELPGIADVHVYSEDGKLLGERRVVLDEEIILPSLGEEESYRIVVTPIQELRLGGGEFSIQPWRGDLDYETESIDAVVFTSPTSLQLALFAHMAFFPFDFHRGERPQGRGHSKIHYQPFYENIMNSDRVNAYGFNFLEQMTGWNLSGIYEDVSTGFSIVVYVNDNRCRTVLAIRGSDGDIMDALSDQSGTWWCNFNTLAGYPHSHVASLVNFLYEQRELLEDTRIYITGHSLGGYLAYLATHELVRMGLEDNIRRVVAFSAPIFTPETTRLISSLDPVTRSRIVHFYVPDDLIAGFIGVEMPGEFPSYASFAHVSQLFETMRDVRGIDIPFTVEAISNLFELVELVFPISLPSHIAELVWRLDGAFGAEAYALSQDFYSLIRHVPVAQTWHSPRPDPDWPIMIDALRDLIADIIFDMVDRIFDTDTHFMMNFYEHLAGEAGFGY
ncbi:MAG: lipase family protein [Defluviitaleaceae bacterium]|nr:lipase family protein [Defluviitaleaceae bacterium]